MTEKKKKDGLVDGKRPKCGERQSNSIRAGDFTCKLDSGSHNVHIDPITNQRWGHRGMREVK